MTAQDALPFEQPERWLPIEGYPNYEVSDLGRIWSRPRPGSKGGILKPYFNKRTGYLSVTLTLDGVQKDFRVNRLVCRAFHGPCPKGQDARHWDGDPLNNTAANLLWGTRKENMDDMRRHGRLYWSNRTHCPEGHPYDEENTRVSGGARYCIKCQKSAGRAYYQRQLAKGIRTTPLTADMTPEQHARRREAGRAASRRYRERKRAEAQPDADS